MGNVVIHQSSAKIASDCLARYKAEVIDKVNTDNAFASLGTAVHNSIEWAYRVSAQKGADQLSPALAALDEWWSRRDKVHTPVWVYSEAERLLRGAYAPDSGLWLRLPGGGQKMSVEQSWALDEEFRALKPGEEGAAYAGRMDAIQWGPKGLRVIDWKTMRAMPSKSDLEWDEQARVYALAALAIFPDADCVTFELALIRHRYQVAWTFKRDEPWESATKRWLRAVRADVLMAADRDEWPATPGDGCGYCPIRYKCEALRAVIDAGSLPPDVEPETAARTYLAAKSIAAQAERVARAAADVDPIPVGRGKVLGFKPGTRKEWRHGIADIFAQLQADGASEDDLRRWFPGTSITKAALEAAALELLQRGEIEGEPYEYVEMMREERPSVTFTTFAADALEVGDE